MPRVLIPLSRSPRSWWLAAVVAIAAPPVARATDIVILEPPALTRKFPEFFCPLPIELTFTSSGEYATFHAEANVYVESSPGGPLIYTSQAIDNVSLVPASVHTAHTVPNNGDYQSCYQDVTVPTIFLFDQVSPATVPLIETFEVGATGWDLTQGAYYDGTRSAHLDPSSSGTHVEGVGCLGLGLETVTPSLSDYGRTSITVHGLTEGASYTWNGWWIVGGGISTGNATLSLKVTGPESTGTRNGTWGTLKIRYR